MPAPERRKFLGQSPPLAAGASIWRMGGKEEILEGR